MTTWVTFKTFMTLGNPTVSWLGGVYSGVRLEVIVTIVSELVEITYLGDGNKLFIKGWLNPFTSSKTGQPSMLGGQHFARVFGRPTIPSWWFFTNPFEKYANRQLGSFPHKSGWKLTIFELPPPRCFGASFVGFRGGVTETLWHYTWIWWSSKAEATHGRVCFPRSLIFIKGWLLISNRNNG